MATWYNRTSEYDKYLRSALWKTIKQRVDERDKGKCRVCGGVAIEVHHHNYDAATMEGSNDDALVSLCRACHRAIEFDGNSRRYNPIEKRKVFDQRSREHSKIVRTGLCVHAIEATEGKWRRITFEWENPALATKFSNLFEIMWKLMYSLRPQLSWGKKLSLNRFTQSSGVKLYTKGTKKLSAVLRLSNSGLAGEIRYKPELLNDPLPELRRQLGGGSTSKGRGMAQKRMAKITGGSRTYKIRIESRNG